MLLRLRCKKYEVSVPYVRVYIEIRFLPREVRTWQPCEFFKLLHHHHVV
jgi:hypothetical protein